MWRGERANQSRSRAVGAALPRRQNHLAHNLLAQLLHRLATNKDKLDSCQSNVVHAIDYVMSHLTNATGYSEARHRPSRDRRRAY